MRKKKSSYYLYDERRRSKGIMYIFFGIFVFVLLFFPFFGLNLRYQVGLIFTEIFDAIGMICLTIGGATLLISIVSIFTRRSVNTRYVLVGIVLLWIGCWCTGAVLNILGFTLGESSIQGQTGYY